MNGIPIILRPLALTTSIVLDSITNYLGECKLNISDRQLCQGCLPSAAGTLFKAPHAYRHEQFTYSLVWITTLLE